MKASNNIVRISQADVVHADNATNIANMQTITIPVKKIVSPAIVETIQVSFSFPLFLHVNGTYCYSESEMQNITANPESGQINADDLFYNPIGKLKSGEAQIIEPHVFAEAYDRAWMKILLAKTKTERITKPYLAA